MKTISTYIFEHYLTMMPEDTDMKEKYGKQVWQMLVKAYSYLDGGLLGGNTWEEFKKNYMDDEEIKMWKMVRRGNTITAARLYKGHLGGRKSICAASDGTDQGKADLFKLYIEDYKLKDRNAWCEVSSKAFTQAIKAGALIYPAELADRILKKDAGTCKPCKDRFFYTRKIKGALHTKCIVGFPPGLEEEGVALSKDEYEQFKQLAILHAKEDADRHIEEITTDSKDM